MNEFLLFAGLCLIVLITSAIWCGTRELFRRWVNNDWCKHDWGAWEAVSEGKQLRFCKKCNKAERGYL